MNQEISFKIKNNLIDVCIKFLNLILWIVKYILNGNILM